MTRRVLILGIAFLTALSAVASNESEKLSDTQRREIIRAFTAENVFVHRVFPMGRTGLRIENGRVTPSDMEVRAMAAQQGLAAKPGDRAKITDVRFLSKSIVFEINGGPVKKKKWYERLEISAGGGSSAANGTGPVDESKLYSNAQGSFVMIQFKDHIPAITPDQVRSMLEPVFDFKAASVAEAYQRAMPPKIADAIKNHKALVGMDKEMVQYAKGQPPRRYRDRDGDRDYEEWIYGQPPQPVEFIRFIGEHVARIEIMQVDGEKVVRTANEVGDLNDAMSAMAKKDEPQKEDDTATREAPSLMRPGETTVKATPSASANDKNTVDQRRLPPSTVPQGPTIPGADQQTLPMPGGPPVGPSGPVPNGPPR